MLEGTYCLKKLSFPTRVVRHLKSRKMYYIWAAVVASFAVIVVYFQLPFIVFPVLLFLAFLASGGKDFPRVFFRTILRDIRGFSRFANLLITTRLHVKNKRTVSDMFQETVSKHPQKAAIIFEKRIWSFKEVDEYSNRIANFFKAQGYQKGDVVALFLENCPEFICIWLGLSKLGVVTALINTNLRVDSLFHCISVASVRAVIFGTDLSDAIKEIRTKIPEVVELYSIGVRSTSMASVVHLNQEIEASSPAMPEVNHPKSHADVLMYIYTSGTTGLPKAAVVTSARFFRNSYGVVCALKVRSDDVVYCSMPLYHSAAGILGVGLCFVGGCTLALRRKFSASSFWDDCIETKATVVQYIGELCRYLLSQPHRPSENKHSVRLAIGNGLRPQIWKEFQTRFGIEEIGEFYGSTEGTASVINIDSTPGACGFVSEILPSVYPVVIFKVDPETGELVRGPDGLAVRTKPGEVGQIVGKSSRGDPSLRFDGYLNSVETKKKIAHDVFRKGDTAFLSGDLVVRDELGYIYFHDRTGDTFRWRGENVSTAEVESVMSKVVGLRDVVVYGVVVPGTEGRAGMAAIVDPECKVDLMELAASLKKLLPSYACPMFLRIVHSVDLTGTFKLQKSKLRNEGFNIGVIEDQLFYFDSKEKTYLALDEIKYEQIIRGEIRM